MKSTLKYIVSLVVLSLIITCSDDEIPSRDYPRLRTLEITNITETGATFNAEFLKRGDHRILNYGFAYGRLQIPTLEHGETVILEGAPSKNSFSERAEVSMNAGSKYYVRSFVQTYDYLVYGEPQSFISKGSLGPVVTTFEPKLGHLEDEITLYGENFGKNSVNLEVFFDSKKASIVERNTNEVRVKVPQNLDKENAEIKVLQAGNPTIYDETFNLIKPEILSYSPTQVTFGTEVIINTSDLNTKPNTVKVEFVGTDGVKYEANLKSVAKNQIKAIFPDEAKTHEFEVLLSMNNFSVSGDTKIKLINPSISSISPEAGKTTTKWIKLHGEGFSPIKGNNKVFVDGVQVGIISASSTEIEIGLPLQSEHIYSGREIEIKAEILGKTMTYSKPFTITDKWFRIEDLPFSDGEIHDGVEVNGKGIVVNQFETLEFDPVTRTWIRLTPFHDTQRYKPAMFALNGKVYLGTGVTFPGGIAMTDFWEFDPSADTWTQKADFPGVKRQAPFAFSINGYGYFGTGMEIKNYGYNGLNDLWKYDADANSWTQLGDTPYDAWLGIWGSKTANLNGFVYVALGDDGNTGPDSEYLHKYDPVTDEWTELGRYPEHATFGHDRGISFSVNNKVYFGSGYYRNNLYSWDGSSWKAEESNEVGREGGFSFVIDDIVYVGGGAHTPKEFWTFDASQPD